MKPRIPRVLYCFIITLLAQPVFAQHSSPLPVVYHQVDSVVSKNLSANVANENTPIAIYTDNPTTSQSLSEDAYLTKLANLDKYDATHNPKPVAQLLNTDELNGDKKHSHKFYFHLANIFARLKLYPLAMKCYFKTLPVEDEEPELLPLNAVINEYVQQKAEKTMGISDDSVQYAIPPINRYDKLVLEADTGKYNGGRIVESTPEPLSSITNPFADGKTAVAYALLIHIQQPLSGKRKIYVKLSKVGHTFITLIKYNSDSTTVSRSFGFYPKKDFLLSATPLVPSTSSVFKDDKQHTWDETIGKFITERKFKRILEVVSKYDQKRYNLNKNNCTDFGLNVASTAGIKIDDTVGSWPLGHGNNPASAGQSVLEGKVTNTDGKEGLFICNDLAVAP